MKTETRVGGHTYIMYSIGGLRPKQFRFKNRGWRMFIIIIGLLDDIKVEFDIIQFPRFLTDNMVMGGT